MTFFPTPEVNMGFSFLFLFVVCSSVADMAYGMLMGVVRSSDGMVYWGDREIETNRVRYEFNRPFLEAKDYQDLDGEAVEATAYALRTMFLIEGGGLTKKHYQVCAFSSFILVERNHLRIGPNLFTECFLSTNTGVLF